MLNETLKPYAFNSQQSRKIKKLLRTAIEKEAKRKLGQKNKTLVMKIIATKMANVPIFTSLLEFEVRLLRELPESELNLPWHAGQLAESFESILGIKVNASRTGEYFKLLQLIFGYAKVTKNANTDVIRYMKAGLHNARNDPRLAFKLLTRKERAIAEPRYYSDLQRRRAVHALKKKALKAPQ